MNNRFIFWLLSCFLITLFSGLVYASTQQALRLSANDPQIQISQDVLNSLNQGADPRQLSANQVDLRKGLSPFVIIYNNSGKVLGSSGTIDNKAPELPKGVLNYVKNRGESRLSWEPAKGVREAAVVVKYKNGYVLVARSLKEVEKREDLIFKFAAIAWVLAIGATSLVFLLTRPRKSVSVESESVPLKKPSRRSRK